MGGLGSYATDVGRGWLEVAQDIVALGVTLCCFFPMTFGFFLLFMGFSMPPRTKTLSVYSLLKTSQLLGEMSTILIILT